MRPVAIDKATVARRFARSLAAYDQSAIVQKEMAARLVDVLVRAAETNRFDRVLELGCGSGFLTRQLLAACRVRRLIANDLVASCRERLPAAEPGVDVEFLEGDMEEVAFSPGQDLVAASAVVQWATDRAALLGRMVAALRPGGVIALSTFGPATLREVAQVSGQSLVPWPLDAWESALAEDCEILASSAERRVMWFASAYDVLRHLKETGVNALRSEPWSRGRVARFCRDYETAFAVEGRVPVTYEPLYLVARRGSAAGGRP